METNVTDANVIDGNIVGSSVPTPPPPLGTTITASHGQFFFSYQIDLGQALIGLLLILILITLIARWLYDAWF